LCCALQDFSAQLAHAGDAAAKAVLSSFIENEKRLNLCSYVFSFVELYQSLKDVLELFISKEEAETTDIETFLIRLNSAGTIFVLSVHIHMWRLCCVVLLLC
jgi:hypothetical protein